MIRLPEFESFPAGPELCGRYAEMARMVPRGEVGPEWGNERDSGSPQDQGGRSRGNMHRYEEPFQSEDQRRRAPGQGPGDPALLERQSGNHRRRRKGRFRRTRRLFRRRSVRIISAVIGVFFVWVLFSVGQAAFKNNGQGVSANVAEWARDHYLGPVVTFGEWVSYNPPPRGCKPAFSLAVPRGKGISQSQAPTGKAPATKPKPPA